jgi:hypothetical protein
MFYTQLVNMKSVFQMSMNRNLKALRIPFDKIIECEPLVKNAVAALRRYQDAQDVESPAEVERLRLEAEALFTAVSEYQREALGGARRLLH